MKKLLTLTILLITINQAQAELGGYSTYGNMSDTTSRMINQQNQQIQLENIRKQESYNRQLNDYLFRKNPNEAPPATPYYSKPIINGVMY